MIFGSDSIEMIGKRAEQAVQKLKEWCDCGSEGCDLCDIAKFIVALHMRTIPGADEMWRRIMADPPLADSAQENK